MLALQYIVVGFGLLICALSLWGLIAPARLVAWVSAVVNHDWGIYLAVIVRLLLGAALIIIAPRSMFPLVFQVLGALTIIAGLGLPLLGRARMRNLVAWVGRMPAWILRLWLLFGVAFGAFLAHGAY